MIRPGDGADFFVREGAKFPLTVSYPYRCR